MCDEHECDDRWEDGYESGKDSCIRDLEDLLAAGKSQTLVGVHLLGIERAIACLTYQNDPLTGKPFHG